MSLYGLDNFELDKDKLLERGIREKFGVDPDNLVPVSFGTRRLVVFLNRSYLDSVGEGNDRLPVFKKVGREGLKEIHYRSSSLHKIRGYPY
jgi:hypothetical protein